MNYNGLREMSRKSSKSKKNRDTAAGRAESKFIHRPFAELKKERKQQPGDEPDHDAQKNESVVQSHAREVPRQHFAIESSDDDFYARAMEDVSPLSDEKSYVQKNARTQPRLVEMDEEALVMRRLDDLVSGEIPFDFADTDEYIEACCEGMDRRIVRKLRRGEFSMQAHLDLHGLNREQARDEVAAFISSCQRAGKRSVLIVHGRGKGSKDQIPVLKNKLASWLTRGATGRRVLAFVSARPYDGGTGAVYVLLRSQKSG